MKHSRLAGLLVALLTAAAHVALAADKKVPEGKSILTPEVLKTTRLHAGPKPSGEFKVAALSPKARMVSARGPMKVMPA